MSAPAVAAMRSCATFAACSSAATRAVRASRSLLCATRARGGAFCAPRTRRRRGPWRRARGVRRFQPRAEIGERTQRGFERRDARGQRRIGLARPRRGAAARPWRSCWLDAAATRPRPVRPRAALEIGKPAHRLLGGADPGREIGKRARVDRGGCGRLAARASAVPAARSAPRARRHGVARVSAPLAKITRNSDQRRRAAPPARDEPQVHAVRDTGSRSAGGARSWPQSSHSGRSPRVAAAPARGWRRFRRGQPRPPAALRLRALSWGSAGSVGFTGSDAISVAFRSIAGGCAVRQARWSSLFICHAAPPAPGPTHSALLRGDLQSGQLGHFWDQCEQRMLRSRPRRDRGDDSARQRRAGRRHLGGQTVVGKAEHGVKDAGRPASRSRVSALRRE